MAKVLVSDQYLTNIADSIRSKLGVETTYTPAQMAAAINSISASIEELTVTPSATEQVYGGPNQSTLATGRISFIYDGNGVATNLTVNLVSGKAYRISYNNGSYTDTIGNTYDLISGTVDFIYNNANKTIWLYQSDTSYQVGYITITNKTIYIRKVSSISMDSITSNVTLQQLEGGYAPVTVSGDSNLIAANIKSGTSIFGVTGTYTGSSSSVSLQSKTNITPTESSQTITPDSGYDGLNSVQINAISSTYIGTGITRRSSTDLTVSGATVTAPAGYYTSAASKSISNGTATAPASILGTAATVSTGTNTLTLTKSVSVTPSVTAGYISAGTASNSNVTLTANVTTKAAATITPGTSSQTIAAGTYITGTQTIAGDADLVASNIISTANIFGVQGSVVVNHYYTGTTAPASSLGSNGDIYLQTGE